MFLKQLTILLAIVTIGFPAIAIASEIDVRAGNVRITTERDGDTTIHTRPRWRTYPRHRSHYWWDRYFRRQSNVGCSKGGNVVRQETTQVNRSGRTVTRSRTTYCR
ncbi:hypothetical protein [Hydrococcus rivularis]|nr:hypothetical protein [Hydrococcus rivularis]